MANRPMHCRPVEHSGTKFVRHGEQLIVYLQPNSSKEVGRSPPSVFHCDAQTVFEWHFLQTYGLMGHDDLAEMIERTIQRTRAVLALSEHVYVHVILTSKYLEDLCSYACGLRSVVEPPRCAMELVISSARSHIVQQIVAQPDLAMVDRKLQKDQHGAAVVTNHAN